MKLSKRTIASRANGARSRGPITETGKKRASINAMRHGLLSTNVVLHFESKEHFQALFQQHIDKLAPTDDVELACIEEMVSATWRLRRLAAIEKHLLERAFDNGTETLTGDRMAGAFSTLAASGELALVGRYESRLHRIYHRSLQTLLLLRETAAFGQHSGEPNPDLTDPPSPEGELPDTGLSGVDHEHTGLPGLDQEEPGNFQAEETATQRVENCDLPNEPTVEKPITESNRYQAKNSAPYPRKTTPHPVPPAPLNPRRNPNG